MAGQFRRLYRLFAVGELVARERRQEAHMFWDERGWDAGPKDANERRKGRK